MLVSVIVPAYKHADYIAESLHSVYAQTYPDIELIVIDDCSPDVTYAKAQTLCASALFQRRFRAVQCLQNERNSGAHATLNRGIALAQGEYIALLNSDDLYHPQRIDILLRAVQEAEAAFAFSGYAFIDAKDVEISQHPLLLELETGLRQAQEDFPTLGFAFLRRQVALSTGNLFFQRSLFDRVGGFIDLKYCHDWDFALQALRYTEPVFVEQPLYRYRVHGTNSFATLGDVAALETEIVLRRYFTACEQAGTANPLAPWQSNWPGVFESALRCFGVYAYYLRSKSGYYPWHRVTAN